MNRCDKCQHPCCLERNQFLKLIKQSEELGASPQPVEKYSTWMRNCLKRGGIKSMCYDCQNFLYNNVKKQYNSAPIYDKLKVFGKL